MNSLDDLILFRLPAEPLTSILALAEGNDDKRKKKELHKSLQLLVEIGARHGFSGNLWQAYLTLLLVNHENAYSLACERRGEIGGSLAMLAQHDLSLIKELYRLDFTTLLPEDELRRVICDFQSAEGSSGHVFNRRITERILTLARELSAAPSTAAFQKCLSDFYGQYGVGTFGLHKAFRIAHDERSTFFVEPIERIAHVEFSDLIGYEHAKKKLIDNTEAFVAGRPANNCILYGDAGTGKSSSIKALLHKYYEQGLRMVEVYKHQLLDLNTLIGVLKNRNYRFIIYMDDLSFEDFEIEYKYLKAVIEGGLEKKPDNILIYATSNRRHLIRESFSDREEGDLILHSRNAGVLQSSDDSSRQRSDDLHKNQTVQEKLSLVARFGVSIYFGAPTPQEYQEIVLALAKRHGIKTPEKELLLEANQWELSHGGLSGRTAAQFIIYKLSSAQ